jgi:hypothetical protein
MQGCGWAVRERLGGVLCGACARIWRVWGMGQVGGVRLRAECGVQRLWCGRRTRTRGQAAAARWGSSLQQ